MSAKPNVLILFTDDQRFDTISALGNQQIHSLNMDMLVNRGTSFINAHIPGGTSGAVCMPSRAMLMTGRTLFHLDDEGQQIPAGHITMGQCFQQHGYETYGIGKWHNGTESYARTFTDGDEIFFGGMEDHWNVPAYSYDPTGKYDKQIPICHDPFYSNAVRFWPGEKITAGKHSTELFSDAAINLLDKHDKNNPFFMYVAFMAPHDPRTMPQEFRDMYDPEKIELPPNYRTEYEIDFGIGQIRDEILADYPRKESEVKRHIAEYYAMITHLDFHIGRIVEHLKNIGEYENTIIVLAGDNGLAVGQHAMMGKQNLYDHSVRVPLIFAGPGITENTRRDELVYLLDIFPSLCDCLNFEKPTTVEGISFAPALKNEKFNSRQDLYLAYEKLLRGITDGKYKLIEYHTGQTQLFDLAQDPHETRNLADMPEHQQRINMMRKKITQYRDQWDELDYRFGDVFWKSRPTLK